MFIKVMVASDRGVRCYVEHLVCMTSHKMNFISLQNIKKSGGIGHIVIIFKSGGRRIKYLCMRRKHNRCGLIHVREIFCKPVQLFGGDCLLILPGSGSVVVAG